jgi:hypothetical protein
MGGVTGIRAQWTEPTASGKTDSFLLAWIGIGGWDWTYNNIVQIGTADQVGSTGSATHQVWYETLPPNHWHFPGVPVNPGDRIFASILQSNTSPQQWNLLLVDVTTNTTFDITVTFSSLQAYATVVVEDPDATSNNGPPYYPLASFSAVTFSNIRIRYGRTWVPAASVYGIHIDMVQYGSVVASARPLDPSHSSFTAS